ncbi:hypothetical protein ABVN80_08400 [Acinetobacter baumannii]
MASAGIKSTKQPDYDLKAIFTSERVQIEEVTGLWSVQGMMVLVLS